MPGDPVPEPAPPLRVEPESKTTNETVTEVTKRPTDDLVTTSHPLRIGRRTLHCTADAGRLVLREDRCEDGVFKGFRPKAEISATTYTLDDSKPGQRSVTLAFKGGPASFGDWLHLRFVRPRRAGSRRVIVASPQPSARCRHTEGSTATRCADAPKRHDSM